jgi:hypothetical protein
MSARTVTFFWKSEATDTFELLTIAMTVGGSWVAVCVAPPPMSDEPVADADPVSESAVMAPSTIAMTAPRMIRVNIGLLPSREVGDMMPADSPERVARNWRNIDKKLIYITPALSTQKLSSYI